MHRFIKNYFFLICSADAFELPICYCDNFRQVCAFFNKDPNQLRSIMSHHKNRERYNTNYIRVTASSDKYKIVKCYDDNGQISCYEDFRDLDEDGIKIEG